MRVRTAHLETLPARRHRGRFIGAILFFMVPSRPTKCQRLVCFPGAVQPYSKSRNAHLSPSLKVSPSFSSLFRLGRLTSYRPVQWAVSAHPHSSTRMLASIRLGLHFLMVSLWPTIRHCLNLGLPPTARGWERELSFDVLHAICVHMTYGIYDLRSSREARWYGGSRELAGSVPYLIAYGQRACVQVRRTVI